MDQDRLEALKRNPKQRAAIACFSILVSSMLMALYGINLEADMTLEEQCCAVKVAGANNFFPVNCSEVSSMHSVESYTNVSKEFASIAAWAIALFALSLFAGVALLFQKCFAISKCINMVVAAGLFLWFITLNIFVFRTKGEVCGMINNQILYPYEQTWFNTYLLNWRVCVSIWGISLTTCLLTCICTCASFCMKFVTPRSHQADQLIYQGSLQEEFEGDD